MIWLTWRQHRMQAVAGAIGLSFVALFVLSTGPGIASTFRHLGLGSCLAVPGRDCGALTSAFDDRYTGLQFLVPLFMVVPLLAGMFWGAPLVARELEQGTHRLVWTQAVTRRRWIGTKLALVGAGTAVGAAAFTLLVTWWSSPLVRASDDRYNPGIFDLRGVGPIAYALFALALGVAAGALIRKTVAAMAVTLAGYAGVRVLVDLVVRQHYMPAKVATDSLFGPPSRAGLGDWVIHYNAVDRLGHVISQGRGIDLGYLGPRCPGLVARPEAFPDKDALMQCLSRLGIHAQAVYQPGNRFWAFQGIESAVYLALTAGLLALAVWWVRRRLS
jgi:hypothetical protein